MNEFWKKFKPLGSQAALVWGIMLAVYAFYMVSFFWGNHDFRFMRYGFSSPWEDAWEARVTQYLPVWILSIGQILPIFNMLLATGFMSLGAILLAKWYGLEKPVNAVLFALLIGLHPYHLTQFYYVHQIISVALWHLLGIIGVVFLFQPKCRLYLLGIGLLLFSLMGYVSVVELIFTVFLCKVWLNGEKAFLLRLKVYFRAGIGVVITLSIYAVMIELLKQYGIINGGMYNTQTLPLSGIWDKFITQWSAPIKILFRGTPYLPKVAVWTMLLSLVLSLWVGFRQKEFWFTFIGLVLISYAMPATGYVSPQADALSLYRIHTYSVPYVTAFGVAFIRLKGTKALRNMALILACGLCFFYARADFEAQKNWFLGNKQDEFALERIRNEIIPQLQPENGYRLSVMGGLYGRAKFYGDTRVAKHIHRLGQEQEYFGYMYVPQVFFEDTFFFYEANKLYGRNLGVWYGGAFWGGIKANTPFIDFPNEAEKKRLFEKVSVLKVFPNHSSFWVSDQDILIIFNGDAMLKEHFKRVLRP